MLLSGLAASRKQPKQLVADSTTFREMSALTGRASSPPSGRLTQPQRAMAQPREGLREGLNTAFQLSAAGSEPENDALREALNIAFHLSDPKLVARLIASTALV